jgi:hypothetical protein
VTDDAIAEFARRINAADAPKAVVYVAGGGTEVFPMLMARGGGSATLLAGRILYAPDDFRDALGYDPGKFVDARAARGLAMAAFRHALEVRGDLAPEEVFGVGSTSKLATGPAEREGRSHEIHAAIQSADFTLSWSITLPGGHDRAWEERINSLFLLNFLGFRKVDADPMPLEHDGHEVSPEALDQRAEHGEPSMGDLLVGRRPWVSLDAPPARTHGGSTAWTSQVQEPPRLLLPGSFRPLHDGHVAMAEVASRLTGWPCGYEISLFHPEKPPLDYIAIRSRLKAFERMDGRIYLTNAPTYREKARLFPGCTFVVGHDTAQRIVDPRFYGGPSGRDAMLDELERLGTRFLVFGRVDASGEFRDFSSREFEHPVAGFLERVATPVPDHVFRLDLSSTEVRRRSGEDYP